MKIKKAVIPVGGDGTRMFPMTKAFPKEFLPIKNSEGMIQPAIMYLLEELDSNGIEEIYIIVTKKYQKEFYEHFFFDDVSASCKHHLSISNLKVLQKIHRMGKKIKLVYEKDIHGFGHVLYYCHQFIHKDEDFLLLLGDQIYSSYEKNNCVSQILQNYHGNLMISASPVRLEEVSKYGIMKGRFFSDHCFTIKTIVEKPSKKYAKKYLTMHVNEEDCYFCVFGTYLLNYRILDEAKDFFDHEDVLKDEYQLTPFLENYKGIKEAFIPNGRYFDIGNFENYNETYIEFQKSKSDNYVNERS